MYKNINWAIFKDTFVSSPNFSWLIAPYKLHLATEFRLLVSNSTPGEESPAVGGCADLQLSRTPRKGPRRRTVALRAPTPELKAVWQNLIQRQMYVR